MEVSPVKGKDELKDGESTESEGKREQWDRKIEFVFACVGFAVGYGNFWRFPFKCFKNGGGAFLIPFIICLFLAGVPLFLLELSIGQHIQSGPLQAWKKLCPLLSGLGYSMILVCFFVSIYYNVILAWSCYYFFNSFAPSIPWVGCHHEWNSPECFDPFTKTNKSLSLNNSGRPSPSREFFVNNVLQLSSGIEDTGAVNWKLALCLLLAWMMVYFCIWKGIRTTGKVVYVTATLPYVMLFVFFVKGLTLDGSTNGIMYYITPKWHKLAEPGVWVDAASQVFYSITIGFGVMLTFASYNNKHNNVYRDALVIALSDAVTSIFSGFVVFSILGYMAHIQGKSVEDPSIATDGPGLVFIVYPAALATLPGSHAWAVIFFLMLITLGLDSQFGQVELVCACIIEEYPKKLKKHRELVILITCLVMFLVGLSCVTQGGMYVFHLFDNYSAGSSILFIGIIEVFAIAWLYGADRHRKNIEFMIGRKIIMIWPILWKYITPLLVLGIFLFGLVQYTGLTYEKTYRFPVWADVLGWLMAGLMMACVPVVAVKTLLETKGTMSERLKILIEPNDGSSSTSIEINELKLTENGSSNVAYHQPETEENAC